MGLLRSSVSWSGAWWGESEKGNRAIVSESSVRSYFAKLVPSEGRLSDTMPPAKTKQPLLNLPNQQRKFKEALRFQHPEYSGDSLMSRTHLSRAQRGFGEVHRTHLSRALLKKLENNTEKLRKHYF